MKEMKFHDARSANRGKPQVAHETNSAVSLSFDRGDKNSRGEREQSHETQNFVLWIPVLYGVAGLCFVLRCCERVTETEDHV